MKTRCLSKPVTALLTAVFLAFGFAVPTAWAQLTNSEFEYYDGNLWQGNGVPPGELDWSNANTSTPPQVQEDLETGSNDDSFAGGVKEDTVNPGTTTGSIPNNKSDLKTFGVYLERSNGDRFLHMFWHRVQDPSGTTLMDFEFNQAEDFYPTGFPVRLGGDLLIMYELAKGGKVPDIYVSRWLDVGDTEVCEAAKAPPCWGQRKKISDPAFAEADGSINDAEDIPADQNYVYDYGALNTPDGTIDINTFGEAVVDFGALVGADECISFGSAHLKSRSSDSFTAQMKDYIAPRDVSISNCGILKVKKVDDAVPPAPLSGATFTLANAAIPYSAECTTPSNGECVFDDLLAGDYQLCETVAPAGYNLPDPACQTVTITADAEATVTVEDPRKPAKVNIHKEDDAGNDLSGILFNLYNDDGSIAQQWDSADTVVTGKSCTTDSSGDCTIDGILPPGWYCVVEDASTLPAGYDPANPLGQCVELALDGNVSLTFVNPRQKGAILITKTRKHAADGAGSHAHPGVVFTITGGDLPAAGVSVTTNASGQACYDGLLLSSFFPSGYTVTETLPAGYAADGPLSKTVSVIAKSTCGDGSEATVSFANTPLTNLTVSVHSQVVGGTLSTIECTGMSGPTAPSGDPSVTRNDLLPGTYTCTIVIDP